MLNFIVNPNAGGGKAYKRWKTLENYLIKKKIEYNIYFTEFRSDASKYAAEISQTDDHVTIVAVGGDGTINEVLEGVNISDKVVLAYIPAGSGNDLARGLRLPKSPLRVLKKILQHKDIKKIDYGVVSFQDGSHRRFLVSCGFGFDAEVAHSVEKQKMERRIRLGRLSYMLTGVKKILFSSTTRGYVVIDGIKKLEFNHLFMLASHIHAYEGGGFRFAPKADNMDGELSVCIVHHKSKLALFRIMFLALLGNHLKYKGVRSYDCNEIRIHLENIKAVHLDGEVCGKHTDIEIRCIRQKLKFIF